MPGSCTGVFGTGTGVDKRLFDNERTSTTIGIVQLNVCVCVCSAVTKDKLLALGNRLEIISEHIQYIAIIIWSISLLTSLSDYLLICLINQFFEQILICLINFWLVWSIFNFSDQLIFCQILNVWSIFDLSDQFLIFLINFWFVWSIFDLFDQFLIYLINFFIQLHDQFIIQPTPQMRWRKANSWVPRWPAMVITLW